MSGQAIAIGVAIFVGLIVVLVFVGDRYNKRQVRDNLLSVKGLDINPEHVLVNSTHGIGVDVSQGRLAVSTPNEAVVLSGTDVLSVRLSEPPSGSAVFDVDLRYPKIPALRFTSILGGLQYREMFSLLEGLRTGASITNSASASIPVTGHTDLPPTEETLEVEMRSLRQEIATLTSAVRHMSKVLASQQPGPAISIRDVEQE